MCIRDRVETEFHGEPYTFIITGSYSDYMQLGKSARLNAALDLSELDPVSYTHLDVYKRQCLRKSHTKKNISKKNCDSICDTCMYIIEHGSFFIIWICYFEMTSQSFMSSSFNAA